MFFIKKYYSKQFNDQSFYIKKKLFIILTNMNIKYQTENK